MTNATRAAIDRLLAEADSAVRHSRRFHGPILTALDHAATAVREAIKAEPSINWLDSPAMTVALERIERATARENATDAEQFEHDRQQLGLRAAMDADRARHMKALEDDQ